MALRPYQDDLVDRVYREWSGGKRAVVLQLGTGGGKTHTAAEGFIARECGRVLFLASLSSLLADTYARLVAMGIDASIVAPWAPQRHDARVLVASVDTLHIRELTFPGVALVILDECHESEADTVQSVLAAYPSARLLGLSATPARADGRALGHTWDVIVNGPTNRELIAMGALVPWKVLVPERGKGDPGKEILFRKWSRALVFARTVKQATELAAEVPRAEVMIGSTPEKERASMRARYRSGETRALIGCGVFIQGFDEPATDLVVLASPFGSLVQYLQACGRGARPFPGKTHCTVIDCLGAALVHGTPDEDREWTLEGSGSRSTSTTPLPPMAHCVKCWATFRKADTCPRCGTPVALEQVEPPSAEYKRWAKMVELEKIPPVKLWDAYYKRMMFIAQFKCHIKDQARAMQWAKQKTEDQKGPRPSEADPKPDGSGRSPTP